MSERLACKAVGLARSTYRRLPMAATPADPDAQLRAWLRAYATKHPCHGFRRAWAALRYDERSEVNKKKVHRLWREEGLQVRVHSPRKRAGVSSIPPIEADAPKVVWAIDFQFDSTIDGKAIKIASMVDEHTRESLLDLVERSITAERLVDELEKVFAARRHAEGVAVDNGQCSSPRRCDSSAKDEWAVICSDRNPWNNGYVESFNNRLRDEYLNRNQCHTLLEARVVIGDSNADYITRHRHSSLGYRTPDAPRSGCRGRRYRPRCCRCGPASEPAGNGDDHRSDR